MQAQPRYQNLFPREGNYELIKASDHLNFSTVLDIGLGQGGASLYFADHNKKVVALGTNINGANLAKEILENKNITIIESIFEAYATKRKFDAILMSHVLEHTQNVGLFLEKAHKLLSQDGWLMVMVPPYKEYVVGGHLSPGWNTGHLMYNLLLSGFNIKNGHYICYGHNICAFVQKAKYKLPKLDMDNGDIEATREYWPTELDVKQNFDGNIDILNWFDDFDTSREYLPLSKLHKYETIENLYNFTQKLDKSKKYILFGYREVAKLLLPLIKENVKAIIERDIDDVEVDGVKVIPLSSVTREDYVIITPFKYQLHLKKSIQKQTSHIVFIDV